MVTLYVNTAAIGIYLSILLRLSIVLFMLPLFNSTQVPNFLKAGIALAMTTMLYPLLRHYVAPLPFETGALVAVVLGELIFGMVLAFSILLTFNVFQFAGELLSFQMGFGFAQVADPQYGAQVTLISRYMQMMATLVLLSINGHHMMLKAIVQSFQNIPIGGFVLSAANLGRLITLSEQLFVIAVQIAAPVMTALLLTHLALALLAKFAPQINIMAVSFPLTLLLGFVFMWLSFTVWGEAIVHIFAKTFQVFQFFSR